MIRRRREPVALLVRAPASPGGRRIWGDLEGSMDADFDELPVEFDAYS